MKYNLTRKLLQGMLAVNNEIQIRAMSIISLGNPGIRKFFKGNKIQDHPILY